MFPLCCTVRGCTLPLQRVENALLCQRGHHFDRAKAGYWNLLQPQDRRSRNPGDREEAVLARHRWLATGHMSGLVETLRSWLPVSTNNTPPRTIELGCGEGTLSAALFADEPTGFCGIDLSKRAIKLAARHWPQATWVLANADRFLPAGDHSVDRVVSLFGRRPINEIDRVLDVEGQCIVALPGAEDLIELREAVQQSGRRRSRWQAVVDEMKTIGMDCVEHQLWQHRVQLAGDEIADALAMTYRAVRRSQQQRLDSLEQMTVTLAADLMRFSRVDDQSNSPRA